MFLLGLNKKFFQYIEEFWPKVQNPNNPIIKFSTWCEMLTISIVMYIFTFYIFFEYKGLDQHS